MAVLPLLRQFIVAISPQLAAISVGGSVTYPTLLLHQLKSNDSTIHLNMDTASWVGSIYGLAGIGAIFIPILMQWRGRKAALITTCCSIAIGWIISYFASSTSMILISECFHGFGTNGLLPVAFLSITEMLAPKYRMVSMQLFGINQAIGMTIGGIGGLFLSFRTISIIMVVPVVAAIGVALMWPDSPPWLACKGEFDKCEQAFFWLRGTDEQSRKELEVLITAQKDYQKETSQRMTLEKFWIQITSRDFYVPSLHMYLLLNFLYWSGGDVVLIYFIELVSKSTQNENAAFYSGIIMYSIVVVGSIITNITIRYFKPKSVLLLSAFGVGLSLIAICIVTYLQSVGTVSKDSLLCMYCLISFMICNSLGLNGVVFFICAELMPVKHRNIGGSLFIIYNCVFYATTLKISPYMLHYIGMSGTFLIFTINILISSYLVWRYVPVTKGRTLQEIEDYYAYGKFIERAVDDAVLKLNSVE